MDKAKEYEMHAARCLRLADVVRDPYRKAVLIEMAQTWQTLAEYAKAKAENDKV